MWKRAPVGIANFSSNPSTDEALSARPTPRTAPPGFSESKAVRSPRANPGDAQARRLKTPEGPQVREIVYREWRVEGAAGDQEAVSIVVNDLGRIIFGTSPLQFLSGEPAEQGPCEHMIALFTASDSARHDLPTSPATAEAALHKPAANEDGDKDDETVDEADETEDDNDK